MQFQRYDFNFCDVSHCQPFEFINEYIMDD